MPKNKSIHPPTFMMGGYREALDKDFPEEIAEDASSINGAKRKAFAALKRSEKLIQNIEQVRQNNITDPTQTEIGAKAATYEYAQKKREEMTKILVAGEEEARIWQRKLDNEINTEISESAAHGKFANEARSHVKSLSKHDRSSFIRKAIKEKDFETAQYVLGGPAYLSGISKEMHKALREQFKGAKHPQKIQVRDALKRVGDTVGKAYKAGTHNISTLDSEHVKQAIAKQRTARKSMDK